MKDDKLYRKYRALFDGCYSTEVNDSYKYCKEYLYQMYFEFTSEFAVASQMTTSNTLSFQKWVLVYDQDMIYFMN
jgi:hypothetical protein